MNKTHHLLIPLFGLLLAMGCLTGCIKEDMSDCPPPVNPEPEPEPEPTTGTLKLALTYFMHNTQENGEYVDLFSQQVRKVDVFVFDEEGNFLQQITEEAAPQFADNYTKEIELPAGNYQFVVWGNHYEDETMHNQGDGVSLDDGRMALLSVLNGETELPMLTDSLFHGMTAQPVTVVNGEDQVIPIDLMKNRNDVRLVVRWREEGHTEYCTHTEHAQSITAVITDNNGTYDFHNNVVEKKEITYLPDRFADWYDPVFHGDARPYPTEQEHVYVADFSELRLMLDNKDAQLIIRCGDDVVYQRGLMDLITRIEQYQTQEGLDREDHYLIELEFPCKHEPEDPDPDPDPDPEPEPEPEPDPDPDYPTPDPDPWTAITITINGWNLIDRPVEL